MWNLLYKEFKLSNVAVFIFMFLTAVLSFFSEWPAMVPFIYCMMNTYLMFVYAVQNKDLDYTVTLPIAKRDVVKARVLFVAATQLITILISAVFMFIKYKLNFTSPNSFHTFHNVGIIGYLFAILGACDFFFFSFAYIKTDTKYLWQFFCSLLIFIALCVPHFILIEVNESYINYMGRFDLVSQIKQLPVLGIGIILWVLFHIFGFKIGARCFEKVDM